MAELWILRAALSTVALVGCKGGCSSPSNGPGTLASAMAVRQDCPTGLARCVAGTVEVSEGRAACAGCACAWRRALVCPSGCAIEGEELAREPDQARSLCKGLRVSATPAPADAAAATCPEEPARFYCHANVVYACPKGPAVPVAVCTHGCASDDEWISDARIDVAGATAVMCRAPDAAVAPP